MATAHNLFNLTKNFSEEIINIAYRNALSELEKQQLDNAISKINIFLGPHIKKRNEKVILFTLLHLFRNPEPQTHSCKC
jgi:hypothetical protein